MSRTVLASNSPRRQALLEQIGLDFLVQKSSVHEDFSIDLSPVDFAEFYAGKKAENVAEKYPDDLVIGADTIVVLGDRILGKPGSRDESRAMLTMLSGKTHTVITGVSLIHRSICYVDTFHEKTDVTFNILSEEEINDYIDTCRPFDKAGSYGIQDRFSVHVKKIDGCFYNVVGFPLARFYQSYGKYLDIAGKR